MYVYINTIRILTHLVYKYVYINMFIYIIPKLMAPSRAFTDVSGSSAPALEAVLATLYIINNAFIIIHLYM
jgi:hypothetical protein